MRVPYFNFSSRPIIGLLLLLVGIIPAAAQNIQTFPAVADSYVQGGAKRAVNFNAEARLSVKRGSSADVLRVGYVQFNLAPVTLSRVGKATLKLYCYKQEKAGVLTEISAYAAGDAWQENTLTADTAPALGLNVGTSPVRTLNAYLEIDVTSYVQSKLAAGPTVSFGLADALASNNLTEFYAKEAAANPPLLELSDEVPQTTVLTGTYYVDTTGGADTNSGLSPAAAWQSLAHVSAQTFGPGARILFRAGQSWTGTLTPQGSGAAGQPIVIDQYETGAKPGIHGGGAPYTLRLNNQQHWEINNLEITNYDAAEEAGLTLAQWEAANISQWAEAVRPPQYVGNRRKKVGVLITAQDFGEVQHLHFKGLNVHGINGYINQEQEDSKYNGGIFLDIAGSARPTYFNDLLIESCRVHDVDRTGVSNRSSWSTRSLTANVNWVPSRNVVVRNNVFERTGANALIVRDADKPLMERNLFDHCAIKVSGNAGFNFGTDDAVWQYNEARFTKANVGDHDAGGLDSDYETRGTIIQYNYLHDNDYGLLVTGGPNSFNDSTILRYNILERNGLQPQGDNDGHYQLKVSGAATNTVFHNNVIYVDSTQATTKPVLHKQWTAWPAATSYYNNVFYLLGPTPTFALGGSSTNVFSHNLYYGTPAANKPVDVFGVSGNPEFVNPGGGTEGYRLQTGSAAIGKGKLLATTPALDYFNTAIDRANQLDIGAHQFSRLLAVPDSTVLVTQQVFGAADAYVRGGDFADTNYGTEAALLVKSSPTFPSLTRETFLKYDLSQLSDEVVAVQLIVNGTLNPSGPMPVSVFGVENDAWNESTITWNNRPARDTPVATLSLATISSRQYTVDITDYALRQLRTDKTLSLLLTDTNMTNKQAAIVSREGGALQHHLLITTRGRVAGPTVPKEKFDIYLLIGQSNMAGRGEIGAVDRDTLQNVLLFTGAGWEKAANPLNKYSTVRKSLAEQQLGPGYTFGRKLAAATGQTIGLVVNARGGSSLAMWQKGYAGGEDYNLYEEAVSQLRKVMAQGNFKGIIWHQGEANQSSSGSYLAQFQRLVASLRQDLGVDVPIIAGEIGQWRTSAANLNAVIRSIPDQVAQGHYVSSEGLTPLNNDVTDPHFDGLSQRVLGERYADKALAVVYNQTPGVATLFTGCDYQSYSTTLAVGSYSRLELERRGILNNTTAALRVQPGYKVQLFESDFNGSFLEVTADQSCLNGTSVAGQVSYVRVALADPRVTLRTSLSPARLMACESTTLTAETAFFRDSVARVAFYANDTLLATDTDGTNGWQLFFNPTQAGSYPIVAVGTDQNGLTASSDTLRLQVLPDSITPTLAAAPAIVVANDAGACGAAVALTPPAATDNCTVAAVTGTRSDGLPLTSQFPVGTTTVTWRATDAADNNAQITQLVQVRDAEAPALVVKSGRTMLWPPNHQYTTVRVADFVRAATDNCGGPLSPAATRIMAVTSDEADNAPGSGHTTRDIVISADCQSVRLRAERAGGGNGRVYTIRVQTSDGAGNQAEATYPVQVPQNPNRTAQADAIAYTAYGSCGPVAARHEATLTAAPAAPFTPELAVYPNPTNGNQVTVSFFSDAKQPAELTLLNALGHTVLTMPSGSTGGQNQIQVPLNQLSDGVYLLVLRQGLHRVSKQLIITR